MTDLRILPLLASGTEIVHELGLGEYQVGRSHECDYPAIVHSLPICTSPIISVNGSSYEIDLLVKQRAADALSVYAVDAALVAQLKPTHIITQTQCKVCAVSLEDVEHALRQHMQTEAKVISLESNALHDLWSDIVNVGTACGCPERARELNSRLKERLSQLSTPARASPSRPRVAAIEWLEPMMAAGNWVPELIEMAGGENLFGVAGRHSPWMTWDQLVKADPDAIVALPCGFNLERTRAEMHWLTGRAEWPSLRAVRNRQVYICDGNQYMNRPGPRLVESLQIFAEILHPELFSPTLKNSGWDVNRDWATNNNILRLAQP
jgi:iron complex transport system substrate-binding protein